MAEKERPVLGEWCVANAKAYKRHRWDNRERNVKWETSGPAIDRPEIGMYIGWRTVYDGAIEYIDEETGNAFTQTGNHEVWLFVSNVRENPFHAFPKDVVRTRKE